MWPSTQREKSSVTSSLKCKCGDRRLLSSLVTSELTGFTLHLDLDHIPLRDDDDDDDDVASYRDEENTEIPAGHVTSISVLRTYRRLGLAAKLMRQSRKPSLNTSTGVSPCSYNPDLVFFLPRMNVRCTAR